MKNNSIENGMAEERIMKCSACGQGFDLATEDPQHAGLCRDCGDKKRAVRKSSAATSLRCGERHDGNDMLVPCGRGCYECCGCSRTYSAAEVAAAKRWDGKGSGQPYLARV